jgi:hypothetical protein
LLLIIVKGREGNSDFVTTSVVIINSLTELKISPKKCPTSFMEEPYPVAKLSHLKSFFKSTEWKDIEPIIHDIKFYFIFANSALNPFIYGYCNETMRKAFRITFTCLFKEKVHNFSSPIFDLKKANYLEYRHLVI